MHRPVPFAIILAVVSLRAVAAPASYPVTAQVIDAPAAQEQCPALPVPMPCDLLPLARAALRDAAARLFLSPEPGSPPALQLSVTNAAFELTPTAGGHRLTLNVRIDVSLAEEGRFDVLSQGDTLVADLVPELIRAAIDRAAKDAGNNLDANLANSQRLVDWLQSHAIEPKRSLIWPPRQSVRFFADVGFGALRGGDGDIAPIFLGSLGIEWRMFSLQLFAAKTSSYFTGAASPSVNTFDASLDAIDLGVEGAVSTRLLPFLDLRGGPGLHYLFGNASPQDQASPTSSFTALSPTLFASLLFAFNPSSGGTRMTASLEVRKYFNTSVALPELSRAVPVADFSFAALLGFELPLRPRTADRDGRGSR